MMHYIWNIFQRFKPTVSVNQYAPLLQAGLEQYIDSRIGPRFRALAKVGGTDSPPREIDETAFRKQILVNTSETFERLNACRLELEAVKPESRLASVHAEAVRLLRCRLEILNRDGLAVGAELEGNTQEIDRKWADHASWSVTALRLEKTFWQALENVQQQQPTLFSMLGLSAETLSKLKPR